MIHWIDSFMSLFGYKRPEVWEAERKEYDVTFPAPHVEVHDINFVAPRKRYVRHKRSQSEEGHNDNR